MLAHSLPSVACAGYYPRKAIDTRLLAALRGMFDAVPCPPSVHRLSHSSAGTASPSPLFLLLLLLLFVLILLFVTCIGQLCGSTAPLTRLCLARPGQRSFLVVHRVASRRPPFLTLRLVRDAPFRLDLSSSMAQVCHLYACRDV